MIFDNLTRSSCGRPESMCQCLNLKPFILVRQRFVCSIGIRKETFLQGYFLTSKNPEYRKNHGKKYLCFSQFFYFCISRQWSMKKANTQFCRAHFTLSAEILHDPICLVFSEKMSINQQKGKNQSPRSDRQCLFHNQ